MTIAVADNMGSEHKLKMYIDWLRHDPRVGDCVVLSYARGNLGAFDACAGLVLTGGHDVDPRLYAGAFPHPAVTDIDPQRDDFERRLLDRALGLGRPVLGVCRGLQLANVHLGGSLLPDIVEAGFPSHKGTGGADARHEIAVEEGSLLGEIAGPGTGTVNSSHHQCARAAAPRLRVGARSPDGLIEELEWQDPAAKSFLLLVQWHPERLPDVDGRFAGAIRERFVAESLR